MYRIGFVKRHDETRVHPSAIVDSTVQMARGVRIDPYAVLRGDLRLGEGCIVESHAVVGNSISCVEIGKDNHIMPHARVGSLPQDLKYRNEKTKLSVGDQNVVREFCSISAGTVGGGGETRIGNNNLFMVNVHIAHDCIVGNHAVVANASQLAGHVSVGNYVRIGGMCGIAQFCRMGEYCYLTGGSMVNKDILPFSIASGDHAKMRATNKIGLERAGFSQEEIDYIYYILRGFLRGDKTLKELIEEKSKSEKKFQVLAQSLLNFSNTSQLGLAK